MKRVTLKDVAEKTGVTAATVSMILNGKNNFKEETVRRVREALRELNYFPNSTAKRLATQRTETVAFILDNIESAFEVELLKGIQGQAVHRDYDILFQSLISHQKTYGEMVKNLALSGKVDGIISVDEELDASVLEVLADTGIPFVLLENTQHGIDSVRSDNQAGGGLAGNHFAARGVVRPAVVHGPLRFGWMRQRVEGFAAALAAAGTVVRPSARFEMEYGGSLVDRGKKLSEKLMTEGKCRYDGLFVAAGDEVALGIMQGLLDAGIRIPQDLRVVGYDGIPAAQLIYPSLSTVNQNIQDLGALGFQRVMDILGSSGAETGPRDQVLQPTLELRQSSP